MGYEAIVINSNPETVSTDFSISDKLYFEPLTVEDVMNIINLEKPEGVIAALGGQTAINLAEPLSKLGVKIIGTDVDAIEKAENRDAFEKVMEKLELLQPKGQAVTNIEDGIKVAEEIGYPVLVRPSYVLGGRAMQIVSNKVALEKYLKTAVEVNKKQPVLVDKYIVGKELEVDAVCDGKDVFIPGIMEHVEKTGIHSGDSISVYPTFSVTDKAKQKIIDYTIKLEHSGNIVKEQEKAMTLSYSSPMGRYYEHARLVAEATTPQGGTVKILGTDNANLEHDIIQSGWGDAQGFKIGGKDVAQSLKVRGIFSEVGSYTVTLNLIVCGLSNFIV